MIPNPRKGGGGSNLLKMMF